MNKIINSNPYGSIDIQKLDLFEEKLGVKLPNEYRNYLIEYNGGKYKNLYYYRPKQEINYVHIHGINALVDEPEWASLEASYDVFNLDSCNNDYQFGQEYLSIMYDDGGNQICIKLHEPSRGSIFFWNHEDADDTFIKVADSYGSFINSLISKEEYLDVLKISNPQEYEEITRTIERKMIDIYLYNNEELYFVPYSEIKESYDMQPHAPVLTFKKTLLNTPKEFVEALNNTFEFSRSNLTKKEFEIITKHNVFPLNNDENFNRRSILIEVSSFGGINYDFKSTNHHDNGEFDFTGSTYSVLKESSDEVLFEAFKKAMSSSK